MVEEGKEQTDAYGYHAIDAQYNVRTARLALLQCTSRLHTAHRVCHEFAETLPGQASGARIETPSYIFESTLLCLVWSSGKSSPSGAIRLRQGLRGQVVFGIRLRVGILLREGTLQEVIRLLGAIRLRGIRLRNSSSSAGGKVIPAQRPQCMHVM